MTKRLRRVSFGRSVSIPFHPLSEFCVCLFDYDSRRLVGNLSYPDEQNQELLCEQGACQLIVKALNRHIKSEQSTIEGLRSVRNLAHNSRVSMERFQEQDISTTLLKVLHIYSSSPSVMQWAWFAIASLTQSNSLIIQLGNEGICRIGGDMLARFEFELHTRLFRPD